MFFVLFKKTSAAILFLLLIVLEPAALRADGITALKACEADNSPPEETARLSVLQNGDTRGSDTAAVLIKTAKQKAKEGKDEEAVQWTALCNYFEPSEQEAIRRDRSAVLQYLKQ